MKQSFFILVLVLTCTIASGKEIALTFDDAPVGDSLHFGSKARTEALVRKLNELQISPVMVFANPCKVTDTQALLAQLRLYTKRGDFIGNHTCNHPRLDTAGFDAFSTDAEAADKILFPLYVGQKYFRFPYLNEGKDIVARDKMRDWLTKSGYKNAAISVDNEDVVVAEKLNKAKALGKKIDYDKVRDLYVKHILSSAEFFDALAVKQLGYSPKHVLLLHEIDTSVLYIEALVTALRAHGWKIIAANEAYNDPIYSSNPKNANAGNGIIAQLAYEKAGRMPKFAYYKWDIMAKDLDRLLGL